MTKKTFEQADESFDFGFTTVSESDFKTRENEIASRAAEDAAQDSQAKVEKMRKMILPLLLNLKKDADKNEYIYWPNRGEKIDEFIAILEKVVNS
jgi:hypothetical protein